MNNYQKIYWLTRLDHIHHLCCVFVTIGVLAVLAAIIFNIISRDFDEFHHDEILAARKKLRQNINSKIKYVVGIWFASVLISMFLPTQKEAILIVAGGKTVDFIQRDSSINKIPEQTTLLISSFLEKQINEIKNK